MADTVKELIKKALSEQCRLQKELKAIEMKLLCLREVRDALPAELPVEYTSFVSSRIRSRKIPVDQATDADKTSYFDLWRAYRYWRELASSTHKKLTQVEFMKLLDAQFGKPEDGKYYSGMYVFNTQEDIDEFDKDNSEK
jgi:hypothetical protein